MLKPGFSGVNVYPGKAMPADCANCPFKLAEEGKPYLMEARYDGILFAVCLGQPFFCHKSVYDSKKTRYGDAEDVESLEGQPESYGQHYRMCNGAKRWAEIVKEGRDPIAEFVKDKT